MPRLQKRHLPHRVTITRLAGEGSEGPTYSDPDIAVPAYVEQKAKLVVDRRSVSETSGQEVTSSTFVVLLPGDDVPAGSMVTVWRGTSRERTSAVIASDYFNYPRTPSHVELRLE